MQYKEEQESAQIQLLREGPCVLWCVDNAGMERVDIYRELKNEVGLDIAEFWNTFPASGYWKVMDSVKYGYCELLATLGFMRSWSIDMPEMYRDVLDKIAKAEVLRKMKVAEAMKRKERKKNHSHSGAYSAKRLPFLRR